jgi:hypothetical protein
MCPANRDLGRGTDDRSGLRATIRMNKSRQHITLLATSISYVLVILGMSIVNVALENISRDRSRN